MRQEDINDMMKTPEEGYLLRKSRKLEPYRIYCPKCGYAYLGNGVDLCIECQSANNAPANIQQQVQADSSSTPNSLNQC